MTPERQQTPAPTETDLLCGEAMTQLVRESSQPIAAEAETLLAIADAVADVAMFGFQSVTADALWAHATTLRRIASLPARGAPTPETP